MVKFRFNLRKSRTKQRDALPPSTTRPRPGAAAANNKPKNESSNKTRFNKKKGPGGIEVTTTTATSTGSSGVQQLATNDEVSVMTPVTGIPPDSPDRLRNLPSLLPPPHSQQQQPPAMGHLYSGNYSPPSTPSRIGDGGMNINVTANNIDDEISVMTPSHGVPSPDMKHQQQRLAPPQILDDDQSQEFMVYEDESRDDSGGGGYNKPIKLNPTISTSQAPTTKPSNKKKLKKQMSDKVSNLLQSKKSWLTSTTYFTKAIDSSFDMIDVDKSGDVTLEELYAGLLLIHLKMAIYVGAPACRPASKSYVSEIFHLLDKDNSGTLTKEEFATVMKILYSQVFTRIIIQWSLTLMIVPVISQYIIKYTTLFLWIAHEFWKDIDDDLDPLQRLLWKLWYLFLYFTPQFLDSTGEIVYETLSKVPWKSIPFTMLTVAQTSIALPYALNRVEDFFRWAAQSDVNNK